MAQEDDGGATQTMLHVGATDTIQMESGSACAQAPFHIHKINEQVFAHGAYLIKHGHRDQTPRGNEVIDHMDAGDGIAAQAMKAQAVQPDEGWVHHRLAWIRIKRSHCSGLGSILQGAKQLLHHVGSGHTVLVHQQDMGSALGACPVDASVLSSANANVTVHAYHRVNLWSMVPGPGRKVILRRVIDNDNVLDLVPQGLQLLQEVTKIRLESDDDGCNDNTGLGHGTVGRLVQREAPWGRDMDTAPPLKEAPIMRGEPMGK